MIEKIEDADCKSWTKHNKYSDCQFTK